MDKVLISWSVPNMVTIWLMLFAGLFLLTLVTQFIKSKAGSQVSNNSGGY